MIDDGNWKPELGVDGSDRVGRLLTKMCKVSSSFCSIRSSLKNYKPYQQNFFDQFRPSNHLSVPTYLASIMHTVNSLSTLALVLAASLSVHASPITEDAKLESRATIDCGDPSENAPDMSLM
jgi:hypothetical protein